MFEGWGTIGRAGASATALLAACVQVPEPSLDTATSDAGGVTESSSGDPTSGPGELEPTAFPLYWAVHSDPVDIPSEAIESLDVRDNVYLFTDLGFGQTPANVDDPQAFMDSIVERVEATVPDDGAPGLGLLRNADWEVPWCRASDVDRDAFAASDLGTGLSEEELGPAWEAAAVSLLTGLVERTRAARPNLEWTISSLPRQEYWGLVRDEPASIQAWRDCVVLDPAAMQVWDALDLLVPELPFFYPSLDDEGVRERNVRYVERFTQGARLSGKPVVLLMEGRYHRSSDMDTNPIMWLPLLQDDLDIMVEGARVAGARGIVYWFDSGRCWNYDEGCDAPDVGDPSELFLQYFHDVVQPAFEAAQ